MNDDYKKRVLIDINTLIYNETKTKGILKKLLSKKEDEETSIVKMGKETTLSENSKINSVEIFILEGTYINEFGIFNSGTYLCFDKEDEALVITEEGCIIFKKINYFKAEKAIIIDTNTTPWLVGQGNLTVMPLSEQTALVKWTKGEKIIPHKHWGGEEVFVLKGTFIDEYGKYPKGCWIRSPHLSEHFPYVEEETIIFVKTGHL